jgi:hypothetical protein
MATRGQIKDSFYDELVSAATGTFDVTDANGNVEDTITVEADDVSIINPETPENVPGVVFDDAYTPLTYNGVGRSENIVQYTQSGDEDTYIYHEYRRGQFDVSIQAPYESAKEPIYEAVHTVFHQYQFGPWNSRDFQSECIDIRVDETTRTDSGDAEDIIRGDTMTVLVDYYRQYEFSTQNIDEVVSQIDADNDGTVDSTYSTQ